MTVPSLDTVDAWVRRLLPLLFALRVQIVGFVFLWPVSGWLFQKPLLRGLADLDSRQVALVSFFAALQCIYLAVTANLVLLWGSVRTEGGRGSVNQEPELLLNARRFISVLSLLIFAGFMNGVRARSTAAHFWLATWASLAVTLGSVLVLEELGNAFIGSVKYRFFLAPLGRFWGDGLVFRRFHDLGAGMVRKLPRRVWRVRRRLMQTADWALGPGFLDYLGKRPRLLLPGHMMALLIFSLMTAQFYDQYFQFAYPQAAVYRLRLITPSALSMALSGGFVVIGILAFLSFWGDRYRIPLTAIFLGWIVIATRVTGINHEFWSEPVNRDKLEAALTPGEVLAAAPRKIVVIAAAGGGIQASGWTAQVLSGLREDQRDFQYALRVISGVSGGAVGAMFYAGTYDGVWGPAYSPEECRRRAMASSMNAVAQGMAYPDLHRSLIPIPWQPWRDQDRGWALERAFAQTAGKFPGPTMLSLAPLVRTGLPVLLLNATLSAEALPVVFSNSRYPSRATPANGGGTRRTIRSFHDDFSLDTRLETAARLSATFPLVSPAPRPSAAPESKNAYVDGGYFDNSGLYSLMGWLEQAAAAMRPSDPPREVMLLQIDAFPETPAFTDSLSKLPWYRQLSLPAEVVMSVRESGQATRDRHEFPLLAKSLEGRLNIRALRFRYQPVYRCSFDPPPLSWHLTRYEQDCIREGWKDSAVKESRRQLSDWLAAP